MTRAQTVALVLGVSAIFAVALVFNIGGRPAPLGVGAAAIIGAFIGGASAAVTSYLADRRRFKREDKYRDHSERRQAYTEFLTSWHSYEETRTRSHPPASRQEREEASLQFQRS